MAIVSDPELGLDYSRLVHADQSFAAPPRRSPLATSWCSPRGSTASMSRAGNDMLTVRTEIAGADGAAVSTTTATLVFRGEIIDRRADIEVGHELPPLSVRVTRADLVRYAGASLDFNPIHWNDQVALEAGLPGVIAHGMLTMALAGRIVTDWVGDPGAVLEYGARFTRPVAGAQRRRGRAGRVHREGDREARGRHREDRHHRQVRRRDRARQGHRGRPALKHAERGRELVLLGQDRLRTDSAGLAEEVRHPVNAGDQVVLGQRVGQPEVAGGAERLAGHDRDLGML